MAFAKKKINVSFSLADGVFAGGGNSQKLTGLRVQAKVSLPGGAEAGTAMVAVYGLPLQMANQLSNVGRDITKVKKNKITIEAGDDVDSVVLVFTGTITLAYVDAANMPQVCLRVVAVIDQLNAVKPAKPTSVKGSADAAQLFGQIAQKMGLSLENNGIQAKISNPYLHGSLKSQVQQLAAMAGVEYYIENEQTLAIWKPGAARQGGNLTISRDNGLVGYPAFNQAGVVLTTRFRPGIKYAGTINVRSDLTSACGDFVVTQVDYDLESETPGGHWFAIIQAAYQTGSGTASDQE